MTHQPSVYVQTKQLERDIGRIVAASLAAELVEPAIARQLKVLKQDMADARLDIRDYELAETRPYQVRLGKQAAKRLEAVRQGILAASQHGVFGALEVAELSARIDAVTDELA